MNVKKLALGLAVSTGLGASVAMAATNPVDPKNTTSTGDFYVRLYNGTQVKLYGLQDFDFTNTGTDVVAGLNDKKPLCVASNVPEYNVSFASTQNFTLTSTDDPNPDNNVPYTVSVYNGGSAVDGASWGENGTLPSGAYHLTDRFAASSTNLAETAVCPADAVEMRVDVGKNTVEGGLIQPGTYSDIVTVTVSPI